MISMTRWVRINNKDVWIDADYKPTAGNKIADFVNDLHEAFQNVVVIAFFIIALFVGPALFLLLMSCN